jgi:hypothetical protein
MHKYTFTINITRYRVQKNSQHSDNSLGYSQISVDVLDNLHNYQRASYSMLR